MILCQRRRARQSLAAHRNLWRSSNILSVARRPVGAGPTLKCVYGEALARGDGACNATMILAAERAGAGESLHCGDEAQPEDAAWAAKGQHSGHAFPSLSLVAEMEEIGRFSG